MTSRLGIRGSIAITAALALTLGACGGDDDSGGGGGGGGGDVEAAADTEVGQALTAELMSESEDSPVSTEEEARCIAGEIVSTIGEDRLTDLGVTADEIGDIEDVDFSADEAGTIVDAMFDCVDIQSALAAEFEADFGAEGAECLASGLSDDLLRELMASSFLGDESDEMSEEFFQAFLDIAAECDLPLN